MRLTCRQLLPASDEMNIPTLLYDSSAPMFPAKRHQKMNTQHKVKCTMNGERCQPPQEFTFSRRWGRSLGLDCRQLMSAADLRLARLPLLGRPALCAFDRQRVCLLGEMIPAPADVSKGAAGEGTRRETAAEACVFLGTLHTVKTKHARPNDKHALALWRCARAGTHARRRAHSGKQT